MVLDGRGIHIFWNNLMVTKGVGLNTSVNTAGLWTDSSKACWRVIERGSDYFKVRVVFNELPLKQIWKMRITDKQEIYWQVDNEIEEWLHVDEFRISCMTNVNYKTWVNGYRHCDFPSLTNNWQDICLEGIPTFMIGVRFPVDAQSLPAFTLELPGNTAKDFLPFIQNPPLDIDAHIIGFKRVDPEGEKDRFPGQYPLFMGTINLFAEDHLLDMKVEGLRRNSFYTAMQGKTSKIKARQNPEFLLINLPWKNGDRWGVRAGSRWPHIKDLSEGNYLPFPFFLAYAAALLQKNNFRVRLIDALSEQINEEACVSKILSLNFDYLVVETSIPSFYNDLSILKRLSQAGVSVILCGPCPEIYEPRFMKNHPFVDFVLCGEYEFTLLELAKALREDKDFSKIPGLIWRDDGGIIKNPPRASFDINLLPWPLREGLSMEKYWDLPGDIPHPSVQMLSSRGCPFGCSFCLWPHVMYKNNAYRVRPIKDVIDEMEYLVREKKFQSVYFDDDTFNIGKDRMLQFSHEIIKRGLQGVPWAIMARADLMDQEILSAMKFAGLWAVKYGVESYYQAVTNSCNKNMDLEKSTKMIKLTKELGIKVHLTFTFGLAGETRDTIDGSIDYALSLDPDSIQFSILTPFPGTKLFEELDRKGHILTKDWSKYDGHGSCVFKPDNLTPEDLEKGKEKAYRLWGEYQRKKRGFAGDLKRFKDYFKREGLSRALRKTFDYLEFVWLRKKNYLHGKA